jgi:hypothetical protein
MQLSTSHWPDRASASSHWPNARAWGQELTAPSACRTCCNPGANDGHPTAFLLAPGTGNWDQPNHTTCRGLVLWEHPTYCAFRGVFGVSCLSLQRLPSGLGFRDDGAIGTREEPAGFRRNLIACNVLGRSGVKAMEGGNPPGWPLLWDTPRAVPSAESD